MEFIEISRKNFNSLSLFLFRPSATAMTKCSSKNLKVARVYRREKRIGIVEEVPCVDNDIITTFTTGE